MMTHFGDPCRHCGVPLDDVPVGPCQGDPGQAIVIAYASLGVRHDGVEHFRYRTSDNAVHESWSHISFHAPYYHFGARADLTNPPRYDPRLKLTPPSNHRLSGRPRHTAEDGLVRDSQETPTDPGREP